MNSSKFIIKTSSFCLIIVLFAFIHPTVFADPYQYFSPVDVGNNPQRSAPTDIKNVEDKDSKVYSNDIDKSPVTCSYDNQVSEDKTPNSTIIDKIIQYIRTQINSLMQTKSTSTYTNDVFRNSHLQFSKDPSIKINSTEKEQKDSFKNYDDTGRNTSVRAQPYKYQQVSKGQFIEDAAISLTKTKDVIALDEQIAWNCSGTCKDLIDKDGNKPSGCTPITISEIGYYFYTNNQSTSYKLENGQAVNIPFSSDATKVFGSYSTYRPAFKNLAPATCYQTLYKNMPIAPRGTVNTKYVFYNNNQGTLEPTPAYRALPLAASLGSTQTSTTIGLVLPKKQNTPADNQNLCQNFKPLSPIPDRPSPFSILAFIKAFIEWIDTPKTLSRPIKTDLVLPQNLAENIQKDDKFLNDLIPAKNQKQENFKAEQDSSTDSNATANIPDVGNKDSVQRVFFTKMIIPKDWQQIGSGSSNPDYPMPTGTYPPGSIPASVLRWCPLIKKYAASTGIPANIIAAQMTIESQGNPNAISFQGAVGLLQVMPSDGIAARLFPGVFKGRPTTAQLLDPEFNVKYATSLLKGMADYWGGIRNGLFHYGPTGVGYAGYADKILGIAQSNPNACQ